MKKLYVGNLPYSVTDADLRALFSQYGELIDVRLIRDRETNRSKGFGFVEYQTEAAARTGMAALDGQDFQGRPLKISLAREKDGRGGEGGGNGGFGGGRDGGGFGGGRDGGGFGGGRGASSSRRDRD